MKITKLSESEEMVEINGMAVRRNIGGIATRFEANGGSLAVNLGQRVYANGHFGPPDGTLGIVIGINLPGDGRTTNCIDVWFEGECQVLHMKFKDLQTERLAETAPR